MVANSKLPVFAEEAKLTEEKGTVKEMMKIINHHPVSVSGSKVVAIASSTGGPKSLQSVIPLLPANLDAPVLVVQHMPVGFTASLAERLDNLSQLHVKEAAEGEELKKGWVYIAMGGKHLNVVTSPAGRHTLHLSEEPYREGVRPVSYTHLDVYKRQLFVSGGYRSLDDEHDGGVHGAIVVKFQPVCT